MRSIGGELEVQENTFDVFFTDSGRSSIRLFLRSGSNNKKRYLLPDFFCEVIEKTFIEEKINYSFYKVFEDLSIDVNYINSVDYDVLYVINYFGKSIDLSLIDLKEKFLLEDNVFNFDFTNHKNIEKWYTFNSYRKISTLADGSLVKTNLKIDSSLIQKEEAKFIQEKYKAKNIKYLYINSQIKQESEYLKAFKNGEESIDMQKDIFSMSQRSLYLLINQPIDYKIREERFYILYKLFSRFAILSQSDEYSFFVMLVENRDYFRKNLMKKNIFLPIHWPKSSCANNLYEKIISIPLFENYSDEEFDYMINTIKEAL